MIGRISLIFTLLEMWSDQVALSNTAQFVVKLKGFFFLHIRTSPLLNIVGPNFQLCQFQSSQFSQGIWEIQNPEACEIWSLHLARFELKQNIWLTEKDKNQALCSRQKEVWRFNEVDRSNRKRKHKVDLVLIILCIVVCFSYMHLFVLSAYILCVKIT